MVVVGVDDAGFGGDRLGHLVHVVRRRDAGADIQELPNPRLFDQVRHRPAEEAAVLDGGDFDGREGRRPGVAGGPVGREVDSAAQPVVVAPRRMRHRDVDLEGVVPIGG
jgi:hypothetical protein